MNMENVNYNCPILVTFRGDITTKCGIVSIGTGFLVRAYISWARSLQHAHRYRDDCHILRGSGRRFHIPCTAKDTIVSQSKASERAIRYVLYMAALYIYNIK